MFDVVTESDNLIVVRVGSHLCACNLGDTPVDVPGAHSGYANDVGGTAGIDFHGSRRALDPVRTPCCAVGSSLPHAWYESVSGFPAIVPIRLVFSQEPFFGENPHDDCGTDGEQRPDSSS